jgi:hypothetical protein
MALNLRFLCFGFLSAGIIERYHHIWLLVFKWDKNTEAESHMDGAYTVKASSVYRAQNDREMKGTFVSSQNST